MGKHVNPPLLKYLGWATFAVMGRAGGSNEKGEPSLFDSPVPK
jgi:hypothetical protein